MHDPLTVAFEIRRPWPSRSNVYSLGKRWQVRYAWRKWYDFRPGTFMAFWTLAGKHYYWPPLVTIWHHDPSGYDDQTCRRSRWRWHVHHWRLQFPPLQALRRHLLTRCTWCGGPSRKGDLVNVSHSWDAERGPWWRGERGLFHGDCSSIAAAHRACACDVGPWEHTAGGLPYGLCANCGRYRGWASDAGTAAVELTTLRMYQAIPEGQRNPVITEAVRKIWADHRATTRETDTDD